MEDLKNISSQVAGIVRELFGAAGPGAGKLIVFGVSTSEVAGARIGTAGTERIAQAIFDGIVGVREECGFDPAFQCCEHLNRALVVERKLLERMALEVVAAVPVDRAGGAMAAYAYRHLSDPVLVEAIQADAGVDIGETLIGMHLKRVAVPYRPAIRSIGHARVNAAFTRPKLIGGERAVYRLENGLPHAKPGAGAESGTNVRPEGNAESGAVQSRKPM